MTAEMFFRENPNAEYDLDDTLEHVGKDLRLTSLGQKMFNAIANTPDPFSGIATMLVRPTDFGLEKGVFSKIMPEGECWFSGKCVAMSVRLFTAILFTLNKNGKKYPIPSGRIESWYGDLEDAHNSIKSVKHDLEDWDFR